MRINTAENDKYEINPMNNQKTLKNEYSNKHYSIEDRETIIDLLKFYTDWLYSPIDQDLENKIYFMDDSSVDKYLVSQIDQEMKDGNKNYVGVKLL